MTVLTVGALSIPYSLRRSARAKSARITVTPGNIELVVPDTADEGQVSEVLNRKRYWIVEHYQRMQEKLAQAHSVSRYATGAKIPFRGRMAKLTVLAGEDSLVQVGFRNGFTVEVPRTLQPEQRDAHIETALRLWLKRRVRRDVLALAKRYEQALTEKPHAVRIKQQKHMWGSCGVDRSVNLNWQLVFAPKFVLDYAVLHEMAHLKQRDHSAKFWSLVRSQMPDYETAKAWLDRNEHMLAFSHVPITD